ncbi:MAG: TetR family transcriptional regulator C-terminal domain-containing protein [Myxococcota bacterium]
MAEGHFRADTEPDQLAFELYGVMLSYHHRARLLREPDAERRSRAAVERLLAAARA